MVGQLYYWYLLCHFDIGYFELSAAHTYVRVYPNPSTGEDIIVYPAKQYLRVYN